MKRLYVWIRLPDATVRLVGELGATEPARNSGHFRAEFEYSREWTHFSHAFPIDPESLPLTAPQARFNADLFTPALSIFEDSLPDDWGRSLLTAVLRSEGRKPTPIEMLLRLRGGGTGALLFSETFDHPDADTTLASTALQELLEAAEKFETGTLPSTHEFRKLIEGSSRAGGARPKALVHDADGEWLVKFPSSARDIGHDVVGLEATCLSLARLAGLEAPESRLLRIGARRVLMVKRFDITSHNGRLHMISLRTLCRKRPGIHVHSYTDVALAVRKHSASPAADVATLYRHMVFNAAIGNVDDHLKNFWMLAKPAGYRLAPAFDLVPDITGRGDHTLAFNSTPVCPSRSELIEIGHAWAVAGPERIIEQVTTVCGSFAATAAKLKARSTKTVLADVRRRIAHMS